MKISASKKNFAIALLLVVTLMSLVTMFWDMFTEPGPPEIVVKQEKAIAAVMATEAGRLIGNQGQVVLITTDSPTAQGQVDNFKAAFEKDGGMKISAVEKIEMKKMGPPLSPGTIPSASFLQAMEKYPDARAVVSLLGLPELTPEDVAKLPSKMPKFLALSQTGSGVRDMLGRKILQSVIVQRQPSPGPGPKKVATPYPAAQLSVLKQIPSWEIFDQRYQILTPDSDLSSFHEMPSPRRPPGR